MDQCNFCKSTETTTRTQEFANGTVQNRVECAQCGKFLRYAPKAMSLEVENFLIQHPWLATATRSELIEFIVALSGQRDVAIDVLYKDHVTKINQLIRGEA